MTQPENRWNHNIHYQSEVLRRVPDGASTALDIGCGIGMLTRALAPHVREVIGIDPHSPSLAIARAETAADNVSYLEGDFLTHPFEPESFDLVAAVTSLHHMDLESALRRAADLLRPGGQLVVVGFAPRSGPSDLPYDALGFFVHRYFRMRNGLWEHPSPVVFEGVDTHSSIRDKALNLLPGAEFRRLVMFRHLLTWEKP